MVAGHSARVRTERDRDGTAKMNQMVQRTPSLELFKGRQVGKEVIVICALRYLSLKLSLRDLAAIMSERAIALAHTTILHWVQRCVPDFEKAWKHQFEIGRLPGRPQTTPGISVAILAA